MEYVDFLRLPRPQGERRKSIWGKKIDFQANLLMVILLIKRY